jgi:protein-tyrosine phosphatase
MQNPKKKINILFICSGNTCRSPLAKAYFDKICAEKKITNITTYSVGTATIDGLHISENSAKIAKEFNCDISSHSSRTLKKDYIDNADMIITMTTAHKNAVLRISQNSATEKIALLTDYADNPPSPDIADPFGSSLEDYKKCFLQMKPALDNLLSSIIKKQKMEF